ncbi:MAG: ubiquitin-protein ligase E3 [Amphiamblys sp. WSBS2006]|nr:MAG: ubiquitin-protein ligase E3 [Amphiamblys sp. WSBS2006]
MGNIPSTNRQDGEEEIDLVDFIERVQRAENTRIVYFRRRSPVNTETPRTEPTTGTRRRRDDGGEETARPQRQRRSSRNTERQRGDSPVPQTEAIHPHPPISPGGAGAEQSREQQPPGRELTMRIYFIGEEHEHPHVIGMFSEMLRNSRRVTPELIEDLYERLRAATTQGIPQERIDREIPEKTYEKTEEKKETCHICLADYEEREKIRILPCKHFYHRECIDSWLRRHQKTCPLCRKPAVDD